MCRYKSLSLRPEGVDTGENADEEMSCNCHGASFQTINKQKRGREESFETIGDHHDISAYLRWNLGSSSIIGGEGQGGRCWDQGKTAAIDDQRLSCTATAVSSSFLRHR
jgi:hypothetical protein